VQSISGLQPDQLAPLPGRQFEMRILYQADQVPNGSATVAPSPFTMSNPPAAVNGLARTTIVDA
jgi:hypothetical protein